MIGEPRLKECRVCKKLLPSNKFDHFKGASKTRCSACRRAYNCTHYRNNREKCILRTKRYAAKNKKKLSTAAALWRERNRVHLRKQQAIKRSQNRDRYNGYGRKWYSKTKNKKKHCLLNKALRNRYRQEALDAYGRKCNCCGETEELFLSFDHIKGAKHKKKVGRNIKFLRWLKKKNWPKDVCQILCHNCNQAKGAYGYCPHNPQA